MSECYVTIESEDFTGVQKACYNKTTDRVIMSVDRHLHVGYEHGGGCGD